MSLLQIEELKVDRFGHGFVAGVIGVQVID